MPFAAKYVLGFHVEASDGGIGHVDDFLVRHGRHNASRTFTVVLLAIHTWTGTSIPYLRRGFINMNSFKEEERAAVYKAIMLRRDIRRHFESTPIPHDVLVRILSAAHHAGSVGFMQPWDFILIQDEVVRQRVLATLFTTAIAASISMRVRVENYSCPSSSKAFWNPD